MKRRLSQMAEMLTPNRGIVQDTSKNPSDIDLDDLIQISVCGMTYVTLKKTLEKFPTTLLGNEKQRQKYYVRSKNVYFFDRHRQSFEAILYYYQSNGILVCPTNVACPVFEKELVFFGLKRILKRSSHDDNDSENENDNEVCTRRGSVTHPSLFTRDSDWQRKVWHMFEKPGESVMGKTLSFTSLFIITLSIIIQCVETMPEVNGHKPGSKPQAHMQPWDTLELICIAWFTLEYFLRIISSPETLVFLRSSQGIIDLIIILPYIIARVLETGHLLPLPLLKIVELIRVLRIFKFSRHSNRLQILGKTLRASFGELVMVFFFLFLSVISFSAAIYFVERSHGQQHFKSIPSAFWYSLVTMTTVGYGDFVPATAAGKLIGSLCAITGVMTIAIPVPIIVSTFDYFYKQDRRSGCEQQTRSSDWSNTPRSQQGSREDVRIEDSKCLSA